MACEERQTSPKLGKRLSGEDFDTQSNVKCARIEAILDKEQDLNFSAGCSAKVSGNAGFDLSLSGCACVKDSEPESTVQAIVSSFDEICDTSITKQHVEVVRSTLNDIINDIVKNDTDLCTDYDISKQCQKYSHITRGGVHVHVGCESNIEECHHVSVNKEITCLNGEHDLHVAAPLDRHESKEENDKNNAIVELPFYQQELDINIHHDDKSHTKDRKSKDIPSYSLPWIPYRIWMRGSSIVFWAAKAANNYPTGKQLGLDGWGVSVDWKGWRGMKWKSLIPWITKDLPKAVKQKRKPDMLVVHLGSNDVVDIDTPELINNIKDDLSKLSDMLPDTTLVWSTMLPRLCWRGTENIEEAEKSRQEINRAVIDHVIRIGGKIIKHLKLESADEDFFIWDGVHLSEFGNEIFLEAIQGGLELFITSNEVVFPYVGEAKSGSVSDGQ